MSEDEYRNSTVHWGTCENESCLTTIHVSRHPEAETDVPDEGEWEGWLSSCPVCDSTFRFEGTDPHWAVFKR